MTPRRLPVLSGALVAAALLLPVPVAGAQPAPVTAAPSAEAWYRTLPATSEVPSTCDLPVGCPPELPAPLPSQYAAGTLHVGVAGGQEESRTYVALDLAALPLGSELVAGTLTLPVATDPQAGSTAPDTAVLRACLVTGAVQDGVDGGLAGVPGVDCQTSSEAQFRPAAGEQPAAFTVDLAPFLDRFSSGVAALAVLPGQDPGEAWHVAFSRRDREAEGAVPISASLQLADQPGDGSPAPVPVADAPLDALPPLSSPPLDATPGLGSLPEAPAAQPLTAPVTPEVAAPTAQVPVAAVLGGPFAYPAVFLLPLVIGAAVGWAGRAFTRDLVPVQV